MSTNEQRWAINLLWEGACAVGPMMKLLCLDIIRVDRKQANGLFVGLDKTHNTAVGIQRKCKEIHRTVFFN